MNKPRKPRTYILLFFASLYLSAGNPGWSQESDSIFAVRDSVDVDIDIFALEEPAEISLRYNIREFQKKKFDDEYIKAELTYHLEDSASDRVHTIRLKARGKNRREICNFPPLFINIKKSDIKNPYLKDVKKIKLVTHCGGSKSFEKYVLKEYLAYKIYNLLSPYSFRVRLVRVKYIDTGRKNKVTDSWGILIEPEKMMAERLGMIPIKVDVISITKTDSVTTDRMAMFQYMIGNSDYSVTGRHNVKLLKDSLNFYPIPVPYDFDYTGIVDAHYAIPGENLGLQNVKERYFLGPCRSHEDFRQVIEEFQKQKDEIMHLVRSFPYLAEKDKKTVISYLEAFFNESGNDRFIDRSMLSTCRK
jgi:hypothetical protein